MYGILTGALIGAAAGYYFGGYRSHHKGKMPLDSILILPKGMERKAKKIMGGVRKTLEEIM